MSIPKLLVQTLGNSSICFSTAISFLKVSFDTFKESNRDLLANRFLGNNTPRTNSRNTTQLHIHKIRPCLKTICCIASLPLKDSENDRLSHQR
ncbi:hypothetical protein CR513_61519, partial [Mucuna pruriens]